MIPKISLVGVTGYGKLYVQQLLKLHTAGLIRWVSAVVVNPEEAESEIQLLEGMEVKILPNMDALCSEAPVDWICLPVGIPVHRLLTEQALSTGANVLLEKPAAGSVADWEAMRNAEDISGRNVRVGFQHLHDRRVLTLKRELSAGEWGTVRSIDVHGEWPRSDAYYQRNGWAGKRKSGDVVVNDSPIQNAFAHFLNLALYFAGEKEGMWAEAESVSGRLLRVRPDIETFDNCELDFRFSTGVRSRIVFKHATRFEIHPVIRINTTAGWVEYSPDSLRGEKEGVGFEESYSDSMHKQLFRDTLVDRAGGCTLEQAGHHVRAVDLVMRKLEIETVADACRDPANGQWYVPDDSIVYPED